jgi:protein-disulfide isomerase
MDKLGIPIAIIVAGGMIAGAVIYSGGDKIPADNTPTHTISAADITNEDHVLGDRNASIKIVEYSDTECPFCKGYHTILHDMIEGENKIDDIAWVYRHFPIEGLHETAIREAEATECVAKIAGENAFWTYLDSIYETTESNDGLPDSQLFTLAEAVGVSSDDLTQCLDSGEMSDKIAQDVIAAGEAGARGTPYSVLFLDEELSAEQILTIKQLDLQITQGHPTNRVFQVDEEDKNKVSMSGAIPQEITEALFDIIRGE